MSNKLAINSGATQIVVVICYNLFKISQGEKCAKGWKGSVGYLKLHLIYNNKLAIKSVGKLIAVSPLDPKIWGWMR